ARRSARSRARIPAGGARGGVTAGPRHRRSSTPVRPGLRLRSTSPRSSSHPDALPLLRDDLLSDRDVAGLHRLEIEVLGGGFAGVVVEYLGLLGQELDDAGV